MPPIAALVPAEQAPSVKRSMSSLVHEFPAANPIATPAIRPRPAPRMAHLPLEWRPPLRSMRVTSCRGTTTALGWPFGRQRQRVFSQGLEHSDERLVAEGGCEYAKASPRRNGSGLIAW